MVTVAACLTVAAAFAGYQRLHGTFMEYDDEGYVMLTLRSFQEGQPLYDATFTQYGPAFYLVESGLRWLTRLPLTHDATRLKTLALWMLCAGLCGLVLYRITRSRWMALVAFGASFLHLEKLAAEPGHPQEWCLLGLLIALWGGTLRGPRQTAARVLVLAAATALVACIKLNLGAFLGLAVLLMLLLSGGRAAMTRALRWFLLAAAAALPIVLLRDHLGGLSGWLLPATVIAGLAGLVLSTGDAPPASKPLELPCYLAVSAAISTALLGWCLLRGSSLTGLLDGVVLQHGVFASRFYQSLPAPNWAPFAAIAIAAAGVAGRGRPTRPLRYSQLFAVGLLLYLCVAYLLDGFAAISRGGRGGAPVAVVLGAPLIWPVLRPDGTRLQVDELAPRLLLAGLAVLLPLSIYPTPGTQVAIGSLPAVLGLLVIAYDLARSPVVSEEGGQRLFRWALCAVAALIAAGIVARDVTLRPREGLHSALDLPGARRLELPAREVRAWQWAARQIAERCDTFVGLHHAQCSLYFWAEVPAPTPINATFWSYLLRESRQRRIIDALEKRPRSCVFNNRRSATTHDPRSPLASYLLRRYRPVAWHDGMEIWARR